MRADEMRLMYVNFGVSQTQWTKKDEQKASSW
jgi:hypothetical protein